MKLKSRFLLIGALATLPLLLNSFHSYQQNLVQAEAEVRKDIRAMLKLALMPEFIVL